MSKVTGLITNDLKEFETTLYRAAGVSCFIYNPKVRQYELMLLREKKRSKYIYNFPGGKRRRFVLECKPLQNNRSPSSRQLGTKSKMQSQQAITYLKEVYSKYNLYDINSKGNLFELTFYNYDSLVEAKKIHLGGFSVRESKLNKEWVQTIKTDPKAKECKNTELNALDTANREFREETGLNFNPVNEKVKKLDLSHCQYLLYMCLIDESYHTEICKNDELILLPFTDNMDIKDQLSNFIGEDVKKNISVMVLEANKPLFKKMFKSLITKHKVEGKLNRLDLNKTVNEE